MTFAEIERFFKSKARMIKAEEQKIAIANYRLADLIGRSVARIHNSANKYPSIYEAYPHLFNEAEDAELIQKRKNELSILRFKQFVQSHNKIHKEVGNK